MQKAKQAVLLHKGWGDKPNVTRCKHTQLSLQSQSLKRDLSSHRSKPLHTLSPHFYLYTPDLHTCTSFSSSFNTFSEHFLHLLFTPVMTTIFSTFWHLHFTPHLSKTFGQPSPPVFPTLSHLAGSGFSPLPGWSRKICWCQIRQLQQCCTLFEYLIGQSVLETKNVIGHGVLVMQKEYDTRPAENKTCGGERNMKSWSWHHWQSALEQLLQSGFWSRIYFPFSYQAHKAQCALTTHHTLQLTSAKTWHPCGPDALANTSVVLTQVWNLVEKLVRSIIKAMGHKTTKTVISTGPRSWWRLEQSVFGDLINLLLGTDSHVHHWYNAGRSEKLNQTVSGRTE